MTVEVVVPFEIVSPVQAGHGGLGVTLYRVTGEPAQDGRAQVTATVPLMFPTAET